MGRMSGAALPAVTGRRAFSSETVSFAKLFILGKKISLTEGRKLPPAALA